MIYVTEQNIVTHKYQSLHASPSTHTHDYYVQMILSKDSIQSNQLTDLLFKEYNKFKEIITLCCWSRKVMDDRVLVELKESIFVVPVFVEKKNFFKYLTHNVEGKCPFSEKTPEELEYFS